MRYIFPLLLTLALVACGPDSKHIQLDGRLLNMNQGEFLVYSPDGITDGVDTLYIEGGRFDFETACSHEGVIAIMMPNGQEVPVFVRPGKSYSLSGDAQNLKEIKVEGGKQNEQMNDFRKGIASLPSSATPTKQVTDFVKKNPGSEVSAYIVRRYLVMSQKPDYKTASTLIPIMLKVQPDNAALQLLQSQVKALCSTSKGSPLPMFSATTIDGKSITSGEMKHGVWIICSIASWEFESTNQLRRIQSIKDDKKADWHIVALSLDASKDQCRNALSYDKDKYTIICDEKMTDSPVAQKLSVSQTCVAIIVRDGIITERSLSGEPLYNELKNKY